jgi:hypothetical protein
MIKDIRKIFEDFKIFKFLWAPLEHALLLIFSKLIKIPFLKYSLHIISNLGKVSPGSILNQGVLSRLAYLAVLFNESLGS